MVKAIQYGRQVLALVLAIVVLVPGQAARAEDQVAASPYGPGDERGVLNQLNNDTRLAVLKQVASGQVYDLSVENFPGMPGLVHLGMGDPDFHMWMTHTPEGLRLEGVNPGDPDHPIALYDDAVIMSSHTGTHIDALNHAGYGDKIFNGFDRAAHLGNKGWTVAGSDEIPPIITRGLMIDVAAFKGLDMLPDSYEITPTDLQQAMAAQGIGINSGDAVFIRTGRMTVWPDPARYVPHEPGIAIDAARWLLDQGVVLIGADNIAVERLPIQGKAVHSYAFAERGVCLVENVWLEELSADKVHAFLLIAAPIKVRGATGSSLRPLAIPISAQ